MKHKTIIDVNAYAAEGKDFLLAELASDLKIIEETELIEIVDNTVEEVLAPQDEPEVIEEEVIEVEAEEEVEVIEVEADLE